MGRPKRGTHAVATPERILDAAERAFGAHAFAAAKLADIAREADVRRPSLLYYFPSKVELHTAVVDRLFADLIRRFETLVPSSEPAKAIDTLLLTWLAFLEERPAFAPMVLRGIVDGQERVRDHLQEQLVPLLDLLETGILAAGVAPEGLSVRSALLQIGSDSLLRASAGPLREQLWGTTPGLVTVRRLFNLPLDAPVPPVLQAAEEMNRAG